MNNISTLTEIPEVEILGAAVLTSGGHGVIYKVTWNAHEYAKKNIQYSGDEKTLRELLLLEYVVEKYFLVICVLAS